MAGDYLNLVQGDTYTLTTQILLDGVEQNIYGANLSFFAIANPDLNGEDVLFEANTNSGQIAISGANNANVTVSFNSSFTANIPQANIGYWFLRTQTSGGSVYTLDKGRIAIIPGLPSLPL